MGLAVAARMTREYGPVKVRPATEADAIELAPRLRAADKAEIAAASGREPIEVLKEGVKLSSEVYAIERAEVGVIALFGVAPGSAPKMGVVWLLGSDALLDIRTTFLRHSREWLEQLFSNYDYLANAVYAANTAHVRWLRWLGFRFLCKRAGGISGEDFIEFVKLKQ